jgi:hypothetical protein
MECAECDNLMWRCDSLARAADRTETALDIADRTFDVTGTRRLTIEAQFLTESLYDARATLAKHRQASHSVAQLAYAAGSR